MLQCKYNKIYQLLFFGVQLVINTFIYIHK